jgi:hypothetical protein
MGSHIRKVLADSFRHTPPLTSYELLRFFVGMSFPDRRKFIFYDDHLSAVRVRTAKLNPCITGMVMFHDAGFMFAFFKRSRAIKRHSVSLSPSTSSSHSTSSG